MGEHNAAEGQSTVVISFGSNTERKGENVLEALEWFGALVPGARVSHIYETAAVGGGTRPYMNAVGIGSTDMCLQSITMAAKAYEQNHGRDHESRARGEVPIDIDVVMWNGLVSRPHDFNCDFFQIGYNALVTV